MHSISQSKTGQIKLEMAERIVTHVQFSKMNQSSVYLDFKKQPEYETILELCDSSVTVLSGWNIQLAPEHYDGKLRLSADEANQCLASKVLVDDDCNQGKDDCSDIQE